MTATLNRRSLVTRLTLAIPLASTAAACHPTPVRNLRFAEPEEGGADGDLLALGGAWREAHQAYIEANHRYVRAELAAGGYVAAPDDLTATLRAVSALEARIAAATATTMPGLLVKVRVAGQFLADECEPTEAMTAGIVRDLLALVGEPPRPSRATVGGDA